MVWWSQPINGSPDDAWALLTDPASWKDWWRLGSPQVAGDLGTVGTQLAWNDPPATAVIEEADPSKKLSLTFTSGDDGLPHKGGAPVRWEFSIDTDHTTGKTRLGVWRTGLISPLKKKRIDRAEQDVKDKLKQVVERAVAARGTVPDVDALKTDKDMDGLLAAAEHSEEWVRLRGVAALESVAGDPRATEALLAAAADVSPTVRRVSIQGLLRVADDRSRRALLRLVEDPEPEVRNLAEAQTEGLRATVAAVQTRPYTADERERLRSAPGPRLGEDPSEPFLGSRLAVYVQRHQVFDESSRDETVDGLGLRRSSVESRLRFPPMCSSCLDPTDRSLLDVVHPLSWQWSEKVGVEIRTTTTNVSARFPVPLCERCLSYGLDALVAVSSEGRAKATDETRTDWVRFRFPNLAYYEEFCRANKIFPDSHIAPLAKGGNVQFAVFELPRMGKRERSERDEALEAWRRCQETLGFHRYARLKHELIQADMTDRAKLEALAEEHGVTVEQLRDVERLASRPLPALRALDA